LCETLEQWKTPPAAAALARSGRSRRPAGGGEVDARVVRIVETGPRRFRDLLIYRN